jgi:hypothetical protein
MNVVWLSAWKSSRTSAEKKSKDVKAEGREKEEEWVHSEMDSSPT